MLSNFGEQIKKQKASETDEAVVSIATGSIFGLIGGKRANSKGVLTKAINKTNKTISREVRRANQKYAAKAISRAKSALSHTLETALWNFSFEHVRTTAIKDSLNIACNVFKRSFAN